MVTAPSPKKQYFRIGEVARLLDVPSHVLRYWETEFRAVRPIKSASGQRVYSRRDVERLQLIKRLLRDERYTIEGARRALKERGLDDDANVPGQPEVLRGALVRARARLVALVSALD
ncbi:MAG: transcriptional regulator, MerR family, partial [Myxococcaceae bacterium]|nr:transcriptional regulator, MerR family [Myxococcaceae bacterium]